MKSSDSAHYVPYKDTNDYLKDYLALLSLKLHREVMLVRALRGDDRQESFLGLFISEQDVTSILKELHSHMLEDFPEGALLQERINLQAQSIGCRLAATENLLPHQILAQTFELQDFEVDLLMMALAPEIDSRFSRVFGFLHDDVARKRLSPALAQKITGQHEVNGAQLRGALHHDATLLRYSIIGLLDDENLPLLSRGIKLDNRIVNYLLDVRAVDEEISEVLQTPWSAQVLLNPDECINSASQVAEKWLDTPLPLVLEVTPSADVDVWLSIYCARIDQHIMCLDWKKLSQLDYVRASRILIKTIREAHLSNSILHLRDVDSEQPRLLVFLMSVLTPLVCVSGAHCFLLESYSVTAYEIRIPELSQNNIFACWKSAMPDCENIDEHILREYAERYPIGVRDFFGLCRNLEANALKRKFSDSLNDACRNRVGNKMRDVAQHVDAAFRFTDLVLSPSILQQLRDLVVQQSNHRKVFMDWGLSDLFHQAQGSAVLFMGQSGTGKTMAASVVANELGLDMYRVDLSAVVSKYIGETEKNLERIFSTASQSQVVLFIDEADALFGKRSDVKDAHDRYANIEVSYLLQKMEEHTGVVILASNLGHNIDDAFFRRFRAVIEFALPKAGDRLKLWQKLNKTNAPLAENTDLQFLADRFEMTGGHIKNCIMSAAFQAAAQNEPINMQMLIRAVSKEYTRIGKPISKNSFGDYYSVLRRESVEA